MTNAIGAEGQGVHQLNAGGVEVDFDLSMLGQVVLFVLLWLILKPLLFDPMLKLFEERERRIEGAIKQARKIDEASAGALTHYESELAKARADANAEREKYRAEGAKVEGEILAKVRVSTAKTVETARSLVSRELETARATLAADAAALARELASRVLGREVQG